MPWQAGRSNRNSSRQASDGGLLNGRLWEALRGVARLDGGCRSPGQLLRLDQAANG